MKLKRAISLTISLIMIINLFSGCALKDKLVNLKDKDISISIDKEQFKAGWDKVVHITSSTYASIIGNEYIDSVSEAIKDFSSNINKSIGSKRNVAQEAGFVAEKWQAATYNIDSIIKGKKDRAEVVGSNKLGSVDVKTNDGQEASLKYYNNAPRSAQTQSISVGKAYQKYVQNAEKNGAKVLTPAEYLDKHGYSRDISELLKSIYSGQQRIIPKDQYDEAVQYLNRRINKLSKSNKTQDAAEVKRLQEVLDNLRVRLSSKNGKVQGKAITYNELQAIAELAQKGEFVPEQFGVSVSQLITPKYIAKTAIKGGATAAMLDVALTTGPDLYNIIVAAAKGQKLTQKEFKSMGIDKAFDAMESYATGSIASFIAQLCAKGVFGPEFIKPNPDLIGTLAFLTVNTIRYSYSLSKGTIAPSDYGNLMAENVVTAIGFLAGGALLKEMTSLHILLIAGSMAGSMLASKGYNVSKNLVMQIVDGGGFEVIIPKGKTENLQIISNKISALGLKKKVTEFKTATVSTLDSGNIKVFGKKVKT